MRGRVWVERTDLETGGRVQKTSMVLRTSVSWCGEACVGEVQRVLPGEQRKWAMWLLECGEVGALHKLGSFQVTSQSRIGDNNE